MRPTLDAALFYALVMLGASSWVKLDVVQALLLALDKDAAKTFAMLGYKPQHDVFPMIDEAVERR